jgi:hypothetical protein
MGGIFPQGNSPSAARHSINAAKQATASIANSYTNKSGTAVGSARYAYDHMYDQSPKEAINSSNITKPVSGLGNITDAANAGIKKSNSIAGSITPTVGTTTGTTATTSLNGIDISTGLGLSLTDSQKSSEQTTESVTKKNDPSNQNLDNQFSSENPAVFSV